MSPSWTQVTITRLGLSIPGSPFDVKLRYRRLHIDPLIAPIAAKRPIQEFLIFADTVAPITIGDTVTSPDGSTSKIVDVRSYPCSLQCLLQRLPYLESPIWIPGQASTQIAVDKSLGDVVYVSAGSVKALVEPHGLDQAGQLPVGQIDRRSAWVFSAQALLIQTVLRSSPSDIWILTAASSVWPISNDFRAPCRRLSAPPNGVN